MIRGTTPTLGAISDMDFTAFRNICTVWQDNVSFEIEPTIYPLDDGGCVIYTTLTQDETLAFAPNKPYKAQFRSIDENGFTVASAEYVGFVHDVKPNGKIEYNEEE